MTELKALSDDELHDAICEPARKYMRDTPHKRTIRGQTIFRDDSVILVARLQADNTILRRKVKRLEKQVAELTTRAKGTK
jgi:hypothetical protein